jgi:hypothetical protein
VWAEGDFALSIENLSGREKDITQFTYYSSRTGFSDE